jgi:CysZ protein
MLKSEASPMNSLIRGINYLLDGYSLIFKPGLRRFVIIPLIINILMFVALFFLLGHFMGEFNHWVARYLPGWLHWLAVILWLVFFVSFFIMFIFTFVTLGNIVSAPFNSLLAEKVELYLTGILPEQRSLMVNIRDVPRIVGRQLGIIAYYLPRALVLLLLFLVPVVQPLAALAWFLFNAWIMTLTYMDYPTDNHRIPMGDVRARLWTKRWLTLGFGMSVLVASMIPLVNLFAIPAAVAGATKLWVKELSV